MSQSYTETKVTWVKQPLRNASNDNGPVAQMVSKVLADVKARGDAAVRDYSEQFDKVRLDSFEVTMAQREAAVAALDPQTRADTEFAI
ncbi:MAG: histidinol dehydrogenase, partial [Paracoccaceae bacterium]